MREPTAHTRIHKPGASSLARFIIGFGWDADVDVIEAESLEAAESEAATRTVCAGVSISDLEDFAWAEPYTAALARDVGITPIDPDDHSAVRCDPSKYGRW